MNGLELSRRYFSEVGLPLLRDRLGRELVRIAAGLVGPGSECWGYDDEISRDHDWGPGFCLWVKLDDMPTLGDTLARVYEQLPKEYLGYSPRVALPGEEGRVGVMAVEYFYKQYTGLDHPPGNLQEWAHIPTANLALVTNGEVFHDGPGWFSSWRRVLTAEYPNDLRLRQIAAKCMNAGQTGQYNLPRSYRRRDEFAWRYAQGLFCKEIAEMVFWLNSCYPPYYKWLLRGVRDLAILGEAVQKGIEQLLGANGLEAKMELIEDLCGQLAVQLRAQGLSQSSSDFLMDHGPQVQGNIKDTDIRCRFNAGF